jgi:hypothetical protein
MPRGGGTAPRTRNAASPLAITMNATSPWLASKVAASVRRTTTRQLSAPETALASSAWSRHSAFSRPCAVSATGPLGWPSGSVSTLRPSQTGREGAGYRRRRRWQSCGRWCGECSVMSDPDTTSSVTSRSSSSCTEARSFQLPLCPRASGRPRRHRDVRSPRKRCRASTGFLRGRSAP